jgi:hypothetical protein
MKHLLLAAAAALRCRRGRSSKLRRPADKARLAVSTTIALVVLTAGGTFAFAGSNSDPVATNQRIAITGKGDRHTFVLTPLTGGKLRRDSGTFSDCCWSERVVVRDGQRIELNNPLATYVGRRGTLLVRYGVEWVNAGNGYTVGTGTWKIVRGTGAYEGITGGGRSAGAWSGNNFVGARAEGRVERR